MTQEHLTQEHLTQSHFAQTTFDPNHIWPKTHLTQTTLILKFHPKLFPLIPAIKYHIWPKPHLTQNFSPLLLVSKSTFKPKPYRKTNLISQFTWIKYNIAAYTTCAGKSKICWLLKYVRKLIKSILHYSYW